MLECVKCGIPWRRRSIIAVVAVLLLLHAPWIGTPFNVSYDGRALTIDGQRRILISAGIHYPRAAPQMWPDLIMKAKQGGVDVIETYVFWNGHEPLKGQYDFAGRYDLIRFIKLVQEADLYMLLRLGPYVCAEWNFGGFPVWLRDIPGIKFRTNNSAFKAEMRNFVVNIVELVKSEKLFSWQGGPIILAQIENEYGDVEHSFGEEGKQYVKWAAKLAEDVEAGVPWVMCKQTDAPPNIINTCNGFYCDGFKPNADFKPIIWTENWNGWYMTWGEPIPRRPVEDLAFAVARFFQRGGSFQNYYMYYGGTNFHHTSGGPFIATSYDYDAPIDEYGLLRQPKWGHLRDLHAAIKHCEPALIAVDKPLYIRLGPQQEAHVYAKSVDQLLDEKGPCAAFLANIDSRVASRVKFNEMVYHLPPWSVSILPDCKNVIFNTAQVAAQTSLVTMTPSISSSDRTFQHILKEEIGTADLAWSIYREPVGRWGEYNFSAKFLLDHLSVTKDLSDYLWYICRVHISEDDVLILKREMKKATLYIDSVRDMAHVFVNKEQEGSTYGSWVTLEQMVTLKAGWNEIAILSVAVGLQNYGAFLEKDGGGIKGSVSLHGLPSGNMNLTSEEWIYQVGFRGEFLKVFSEEGARKVEWSPMKQQKQLPLTWYKSSFEAPEGNQPVSLDLGSMGKGEAWVNGNSLGRYWPALNASKKGCTSTCDYRGAYNDNKCRTGCGQPTQRWYHVPRSWLQPEDNLLVLFEEIGGDATYISVAVRSQETICTLVREPCSMYPEVTVEKENGRNGCMEVSSGKMHLECNEDEYIHSIVFASFGNPYGDCGDFSQGNCHASNSKTVVEAACVGHKQCSLTVTVQAFGHDPCPGVAKSLAVEALCRPFTRSLEMRAFI